MPRYNTITTYVLIDFVLKLNFKNFRSQYNIRLVREITQNIKK